MLRHTSQVLHCEKSNARMPPVLRWPAKCPSLHWRDTLIQVSRLEYLLSSSHPQHPVHLECDALPAWLQILDPKAGFLVNGCITVSATVLVLEEAMQFTRDADSSAAAGEESLR